MEGLHPFEAILLNAADSAGEWETLKHMALSNAAAWVAKKRITPSS